MRERRNQLTHPNYTKPELVATGPNGSWDITRLLGPKPWTYQDTVGWMVAERLGIELLADLGVTGSGGTEPQSPSLGGLDQPAGRGWPKPMRRQFTAEYRLRFVEEADRCTRPGEVGRLLRREGLYTSHLAAWRKARRNGSLQGLTPNKRGAKPVEHNPLTPKVRQLEAKVTRLEKELATAHTILDVQGKISGLLGLNLNDAKDC